MKALTIAEIDRCVLEGYAHAQGHGDNRIPTWYATI